MQSMCHLLVGALLLSVTALSIQPVPLVDVFVGGQDGYPAYRIPALVTTKHGTLLAFAEATCAFAQWRSLQHGGGRGALPWLAGCTPSTGRA